MKEFNGVIEAGESDPAQGPKFVDPERTLDGAIRARVELRALETLWINTGTLCNITCAGCYIESSPTNDRLAYFRHGDLVRYLNEIADSALPTHLIGFTGGEPFMNPDIVAMLTESLERGFTVLVLTNGMKPMVHKHRDLVELNRRYGEMLQIRLSLDHYTAGGHEAVRGSGTWVPAIAGLKWLSDNGFRPHVAGRTMWPEDEAALRAGYGTLFREERIAVDQDDPDRLVLFPEMDREAEVPEISERCWGILGVDPASMMCANARMAVLRKGAAGPSVLACTLIPYDRRFELGATLAESSRPIPLNHPHCARFCVLGGGSCSR